MSMTLNDPRQPKTWDDANDLLGDRDHMKIANNTWLHRMDSGDIAVRLHNTFIIQYHSPFSNYANRVTLNSGGYRTVTTKQRMNLLTNLRINQTNYEWFVYEPQRANLGIGGVPTNHYVWYPNDEPIEFEDGDAYLNVP